MGNLWEWNGIKFFKISQFFFREIKIGEISLMLFGLSFWIENR